MKRFHHPLAALFLVPSILLAGCPDAKKKDDSSKASEGESKSSKADDDGAKKKKSKAKGDDDKGEKGDEKVADKDGDDAPKKKKSADDGGDDDVKKIKRAADDADVKGHKIKGTGVVPAWARDPVSKSAKCKAPATSIATIKALEAGTDAEISDGTEDLAALEEKVTGGCHDAERDLAIAINDGGYHHYAKKEYDLADRWWRAALVIKPANILARYNLVCGLALDGQKEAALVELAELARAGKEGDAGALNALEKAKSDADLASVRDDDAFKAAVAVSSGGLVGPREEPETSAAAVKLLPATWMKPEYPMGDGAKMTAHPKLLQIWTWRPEAGVELLVATVTGDPAYLHKPHGDASADYGGLVVLRRTGEKLALLYAAKTGEEPPTGVAAAAAGKAVLFSLTGPCGDLHTSLRWSKGAVVDKQEECDAASEGKKFVP